MPNCETHFDTLVQVFTDRGYEVIREEHRPDTFGNRYKDLRAGNVIWRVTQDRGQVFVDATPTDRPVLPLDHLLGLIGCTPMAVSFESNDYALNWIELLSQNFDAVVAKASGPETEPPQPISFFNS